MNTMACTITAGCLALLIGGTCFAAEVEGKQLPLETGSQVAEVGTSQNNAQLRAWLDSIKPAAGEVKAAAHQKTEYWQQSVRRENRGHMQE